MIQLNTDQIDDKGKSAQSYLALTQLGMGKKTAEEQNNNKRKVSPPLKKSDKANSNATNGNTKDADAGGKQKMMAKTALSTLKGFTKM